MGLFGKLFNSKKYVYRCNFCGKGLSASDKSALLQKNVVDNIKNSGIGKLIKEKPITDPNGNPRWVICMACYDQLIAPYQENSEQENSEHKSFGPFTDSRDGIKYQTVQIGGQEWMAENLNASHFRNGDPILNAKSKEEWKKAGDNKQPAWCYCNNDPVNGEEYGKLYNWFAANDPRGLAPEGWHIPSDEEWNQLIDYLGGLHVAVSKIKSANGWEVLDQVGSNESGFSALPGGFRFGFGGFDSFDCGFWWSIMETSSSDAYARYLCSYSWDFDHRNYDKAYGLSARCLRDL